MTGAGQKFAFARRPDLLSAKIFDFRFLDFPHFVRLDIHYDL